MNAFVSSGSWEDESQFIQKLLSERRFVLSFPDSHLERQFRKTLRERALTTVRDNYWLILLFYAVVGVVTNTQVQWLSRPEFLAHDLRVWWLVYLVEGLALGSLLVCSHARRLDDWYWSYITAACVVCLSAITVASGGFQNPYFNQHSSYVVMLVLMIIYGVAGLRLLHALTICLLGGSLSLALILGLGLHHDWGQFGQYFVMANLVGLGVCYVLERRDRIMFLQARLLELEKHQLNVLSQRLEQLAREDALTGLANRRHFNDVLAREWERGRRDRTPLALIFIDIDHFKPYNDAHGHLEGDRALAAIGAALRQVVRRSGDLAVRYGGEEFVLLLPNTTIEGAEGVARQVLQAVDELQIPHRASQVARHVTASLGVAADVPAGQRSPSHLIAAADAAVYTAKAAGRHRIIVQREVGA